MEDNNFLYWCVLLRGCTVFLKYNIQNIMWEREREKHVYQHTNTKNWKKTIYLKCEQISLFVQKDIFYIGKMHFPKKKL